MKKLTTYMLLALTVVLFCQCKSKKTTQEASADGGDEYNIPTASVRIRDPFVFVDKKTETYYIPANDNMKIKLLKSKDLKNWKEIKEVFLPDEEFWGKDNYWAPDMYEYNGKYYLFVTFCNDEVLRGTSILYADSPEGKYKPLVNAPTTPADWMSLDGSLYIDPAGTPWMFYCHEWLQIEDGTIVAQRLTQDLKHTVGEPITLFKASDAPWTRSFSANGSDNNYVTDAPVIHQLESGRLVMTWSSFGKGRDYCIGVSYSDNGILGPWHHAQEAVNTDDGGHAMLFTSLEGKLMISYHAPNSRTETLTIREVKIDDAGSIVHFVE